MPGRRASAEGAAVRIRRRSLTCTNFDYNRPPSYISSLLTPPRRTGRRRPRRDQRGLVGQDNRLDAVAQSELGHYPADVDLDGARGQVQAAGDLAVGQARGDEGEDVLLAAGQREADLLGAPVVGSPAVSERALAGWPGGPGYAARLFT
jgi:hypothetical protein